MTKKVPDPAFRRAFRPRERGSECERRACRGLRGAEARTVAGRGLVFSAPLDHQLRHTRHIRHIRHICPATVRPCVRDAPQQLDYTDPDPGEGHDDHELGVHAEWRDAVNTEDLEDVEQENLHGSEDGGECIGKAQCQRGRELAQNLEQSDEDLPEHLSQAPQENHCAAQRAIARSVVQLAQ